MPTTRPRRVLLPLLLLACWLGGAGTAQAHTGLASVTPADGSTTALAPTAVTLAFSGSVRGPELTVTGPDGADVTTGDAVAEGALVSVPVVVTTSGVHTVDWAVTSADGHDLSGSTTFAVDLPVARPAPDLTAPVTQASAAPVPTTAAPVTDEVVAAPEPVASTAGRTGTVVVVLLVALVVLGVVTAGLRRRR